MLEFRQCLLPGGILLGSTYTNVNIVRRPLQGALSFFPILPALKSLMSGCPFEVGPVRLAPTTLNPRVIRPHGRGCFQELNFSESFNPGAASDTKPL
jgi:hypothetical protein